VSVADPASKAVPHAAIAAKAVMLAPPILSALIIVSTALGARGAVVGACLWLEISINFYKKDKIQDFRVAQIYYLSNTIMICAGKPYKLNAISG
jgi:hypothetical protein